MGCHLSRLPDSDEHTLVGEPHSTPFCYWPLVEHHMACALLSFAAKTWEFSQPPSLKDPGPSPHEDCNIELFWGDHSRKVGDNPVPGGQHVDDQLLIAYASLSYAAGFPKQIVIWPHLHTSLHRGFAL